MIKFKYKKGDILVAIEQYVKAYEDGVEAALHAIEIIGVKKEGYKAKMLHSPFESGVKKPVYIFLTDKCLLKERYFKTEMFIIGTKNFTSGKSGISSSNALFKDVGLYLKKHFYSPFEKLQTNLKTKNE